MRVRIEMKSSLYYPDIFKIFKVETMNSAIVGHLAIISIQLRLNVSPQQNNYFCEKISLSKKLEVKRTSYW